ncbi:MAG: aminomethyltransferase beta-barrel domain-containing protein, partial [Sphingopyxis sp.]
EPLYVVRLEAETKAVVVGPRRALAVSGARLGEANWLGAVDGRDVMAKVRSMAKPVPARVAGDRLIFAEAEYGVAPGQAAVLYDAADNSRVLGGGWIEETFAADDL